MTIYGDHPGNDSCLIIASYAAKVDRAKGELEETLVFWCDEDEDGKSLHGYTQKRDGKPPWCPRCGYDATGTKQKDMCNHDEWMREHGYQVG